MRASKKAGDPDNFTAYVHRIMESLWLLAVIASALAVSPADWMLSYIQMPKVVLLRILVSLMVILWVLEWAISSKSSVLPRPILTWTTLKLWASREPTRWLTIAVGVFLATYVLSTLLSSSFRISVWGRSAGEDGYSLYNMLTYFLLFLVVATHLRSKPQLWRLLIVIACVGAITSGIGVLQRLGIDALALGTDPLNRIGATFGNSIFMGAFLVMTIPISLAVLLYLERRFQNKSIAAFWTIPFTLQLVAIELTLSRGPWIGLTASLAVFILIGLKALNKRSLAVAGITLGLSLGVSIAVIQALPTSSNNSVIADNSAITYTTDDIVVSSPSTDSSVPSSVSSSIRSDNPLSPPASPSTTVALPSVTIDARLTAEVAQLKKAEPEFYIRCVDIAGKEVECIDLIHTIYDPLNEDDISEFIMILEERCPVSTDFNRKVPKPTLGLVERVLGHRWYFEPPSEEAISKYKDQEYPEWLQDCRSMLSNIHEALQRKQGQPFFSFEVSNQGTRPGNDALVVISTKGNLEICPPPYEEDHPDDNDQRELSIPSPPSPPQGRWRSSRTSLNRLLGGLNSVGVSHPFEIPSLPVATYLPGEPRRDPNTFYYKPSRITEPSNTFSLECQQWRHGTEREAFEGYIFLAEDVTSVSGALECEIHAENLTKPARRTISVQIRLEHVSAKDSASDLVSPAGPPHSQSSHPGDERRELPPQAEPTGRHHALSHCKTRSTARVQFWLPGPIRRLSGTPPRT